jgi:hypothetical protein
LTTFTTSDPNVLPSTDVDTDHISDAPHPIFALSQRLLAYACGATTVAPGQQQAQTPVRAEGAGAQTDLGGMALRVGGSVLSGMRALGGRARAAMSARISETPSTAPSKPLSRSAPEQDTIPIESKSHPTRPIGHHVRILDLAPLMAPSPRAPELVVEFLASKRQPISALRFSADGGMLVVAPGDGQTIRVFQLRPVPHALRFVTREVEQFDEAESSPVVPVIPSLGH